MTEYYAQKTIARKKTKRDKLVDSLVAIGAPTSGSLEVDS